MPELEPLKLTAENFHDYGQILHHGNNDPLADNDEITYWGKVAAFPLGDIVSTGVLDAHPREPEVRFLERHVRTPEILVALTGDSVVCMAKPSPDGGTIEGLQAFYVQQGDAFVMHAGTWHWAPVPVRGVKSKFLVLFAQGTEANDMEVRELPEKLKILI